ncbi:hypothetical protein NUS48_07600 [Glaesserella parasuis]|nr:hypothetical protein [Glaesserella parasuis]
MLKIANKFISSSISMAFLGVTGMPMVGGSHTFMVSLGGMLMWELVMLLEV